MVLNNRNQNVLNQVVEVQNLGHAVRLSGRPMDGAPTRILGMPFTEPSSPPTRDSACLATAALQAATSTGQADSRAKASAAAAKRRPIDDRLGSLYPATAWARVIVRQALSC